MPVPALLPATLDEQRRRGGSRGNWIGASRASEGQRAADGVGLLDRRIVAARYLLARRLFTWSFFAVAHELQRWPEAAFLTHSSEQTMSKTFSLQRLLAGAAVAAAFAVAPVAHASILSYSFSGIAGIGSSMDLGAGVIDLTDRPFTAYGQTLNDIDVFNGGAVGDGVGAFAATTTYDFGALGVFVTNAGGDFYLQNCASPAATSCALLADVNATVGFRMDFAPAIAGDPDFGIAIGAQAATSFAFITRTQTNDDDDTLTIGAQRSEILSATVNAAGQVPVPATLAIVGLGLAGLGAARRRTAFA